MAVTGVVFKFMHWPGAGILTVFGISCLAIVYFALGWLTFRPKKSRAVIVGLAVPAGFALSVALTAIMFKLQHWPGTFNLAVGAFLCLVVIVPLSLWFMKKYRGLNEEYVVQKNPGNTLDTIETPVVVDQSKYKYSRNVLVRAVIIGTLAAGLYFLPWSVYNKLQYWDDPEYARLMTRYDEDPDNEENWRAIEEYRAKKYGYPIYEEQQVPNEQAPE